MPNSGLIIDLVHYIGESVPLVRWQDSWSTASSITHELLYFPPLGTFHFIIIHCCRARFVSLMPVCGRFFIEFECARRRWVASDRHVVHAGLINIVGRTSRSVGRTARKVAYEDGPPTTFVAGEFSCIAGSRKACPTTLTESA